ncbi:hypothetical protein AB0C96_03150 [Streptomyces sp. NPDC048506]|uniref:hypothetical protein n=1 Tax=Streptomyces sp. NPDC048506 TaxID=3155028 RepID=UPI00342579D1
MTDDDRAQRPEVPPPAEAARVDYSGAVYGSLLAASVVVGAGALGPAPWLGLALLLLCTGAVFWAAHVFARLFGAHIVQHPWHRAEIRRVCRDERPIVAAAVPPAVAAAIAGGIGLDYGGVAWLALAVALVGQVGWAMAATTRAGAPASLTLTAGAANMLLGLLIVVVKAALQH